MKNIDMKITEEIAVLSVSGSGYTKEVNLVSWNGAEPKYDIRSWSPGREKCGKGITLTKEEAKALFMAFLNGCKAADFFQAIISRLPGPCQRRPAPRSFHALSRSDFLRGRNDRRPLTKGRSGLYNKNS